VSTQSVQPHLITQYRSGHCRIECDVSRGEPTHHLDPLRTDVGEYALAPRMYQVGLIGTTFGRQCGAVALLALEPGRQYELELWFESAQQRCLIRGTRLEGQVFRPMALKEGSKACA
jgi:hypothetical protein